MSVAEPTWRDVPGTPDAYPKRDGGNCTISICISRARSISKSMTPKLRYLPDPKISKPKWRGSSRLALA